MSRGKLSEILKKFLAQLFFKSLEGSQGKVWATDTKKMCCDYFLCHAVTSY